MGSLPNLDHVLDRREREKERVLARERAREREFCHDLDSWRERALSMQARQNQRPFVPPRRVIRTRSSGNTHHLADEPLENLLFLTKPLATGTLPTKNHHRTSPQQPTATGHHQFQQQQIQQPQLPSLSMPNYSLGHHHQVLSAQSSSNNPSAHGHHHPHYYHHHNIIQPQFSNPITRRRESANSSVGSVRRLLTVNRGCRHKIPVHVRARVIKNFIFLVIGHGLISATLLPLISLQGSNSIWFGLRHSVAVPREQEVVLLATDIGGNTSTTDDNINNVSSMSSPEETADSNMLLSPPKEFGSLLLSMTFLLTSGMCFLTVAAIKKMGHYLAIFCGYVGVALFLSCHLLPTHYFTVLPGYLILGLVLGPLCISKLNVVILMANKLSCGQHECCNAISTPTLNPSATGLDGNEEHILFATKPSCSRDENIRRLSRWFHASQNFGFICGSIILSLLLTCAAFHAPNSPAYSQCMGVNRTYTDYTMPYYAPVVSHEKDLLRGGGEAEEQPPIATAKVVTTSSAAAATPQLTAPIVGALATIAEDPVSQNFDTNNYGERICGAASCPVWLVQAPPSFYKHTAYVPKYISSANGNGSERIIHGRAESATTSASNMRIQGTIVVYLILSVLAIGLTVCIGKFSRKSNLNQAQHHHYRYSSVPGLVDTLCFAAPMAFFIGTEQGYILADFMKAFVSCSLGPQMIAGALLGMGIMQLIASCTLSMLLRHTKRIVVIIAGSFFHACLLLVLSRWKPSKDDSALFFVIAAAWGVCHSVWDTLLFTLMSLTHKNHMLEVLTPIHGIKYLAMSITFGAHGFLCEYAKIIVLAILLIVSVPPYTSLEMRLEVQRKVMQHNNAKSILQIPTL